MTLRGAQRSACDPETTERTTASAADVRQVVVIASASRSGSSLVAEWLRRQTGLLHLKGEPNPFFRSIQNGLAPFEPGRSDADFPSADAQAQIADAIAGTAGAYPPATAPVCPEALAVDIVERLNLQWPDEQFRHADVVDALNRIMAEAGWQLYGHIDEAELTVRLIGLLGERHRRLSLDCYDLPQRLGSAPTRPDPAVPPPASVEETPFIPLGAWVRASPRALESCMLVLKSPSLSYKLGCMGSLFPNARIRVLHLTRNPAAAVNGLIDGWLHRNFFSHKVSIDLHIRSYSETAPAWASRWWKFDLPPHWEHYVGAPLAEVNAFQWRSANEHILTASANCGWERRQVRLEDFLGPGITGWLTRRDILEWLSPAMMPTSAQLALRCPPIMATQTPSPGRWRRRARPILEALDAGGCAELADELDYGDGHESWT